MTEAQTFHLVDGHAGTAHIDSDALARKNQTTLGYYDDILQLHNRFKVTVLDATHVQLWNGGGFIRGRFFYIDGYTKLEVKAGTAGLNRWDALVLRYHRDSDGVETVSPLVITGTSTSGQPTMPPTLQDNDISQGSRDADLLLGRIELTGTNISYTELARQSDSVKNIGVNLQQEITDRKNAIRSEQVARQNGDTTNADGIQLVEHSLNTFKQNFDVLQFEKLVGDDDWVFQGVVVNGVAMISGRWTNRNTFNMAAWGKWDVARITNGWKTSDEYGEWSIDNGRTDDGWFSIVGDTISLRTRSAHGVYGGTWHYCTIIAPVHK